MFSSDAQYQFAVYTIGLQWYALGLFVPGVISRVLLPRLIKGRHGKSEQDNKILLRIGLLSTLSTAAFISVVGFFCSSELLSMYGHEYRDSGNVLRWFLVAAIFASPATTIGNAIVASNGQRCWLLISMVWIIALLLAMFLLMKYGAVGGGGSLAAASFLIALVEQFHERYPEAAAGAWALGGFSFGTAVAAHVYDAFAQRERMPDALLLAGPAVARFPLEGQEQPRRVPLDRTLLVHGEVDDVVPLAEVFDWLRPEGVPVMVVPGAGHFFHGHLITLRSLAEAHIARLCG